MSRVITYLTFNGNCQEAMRFYQGCLGGTLEFQTVGESPLSTNLPPAFKKYILHASLKHRQTILIGTDMVGEKGLKKGNSVSMMIDCDSENEIRAYLSNLLEGGKLIAPLEENYWGTIFGEVQDKFGNYWLLRYQS
ncbi:VOC family protein [Echinicola rosea]|uniref:VOC family protein n=1 Tax=Echinicola rosea TaxID=1807691 RepID=A0ABQ1V531_9BACT|nr:VOC family protein [Echinicola rosea]GGF37015.1 VOC family protein [Echinicola rosea]